MNDHEPVPGTEPQYSWSDLFLRDPNNVPLATDGGRALDPTHPGTQQYVESTLKQFKQWGYEFVKLDFLSHGAMEGRRFLGGMTAIKAYNHGMRYIREAIAGKMFVSLSIAPLFPGAEYGHSRRISCDARRSMRWRSRSAPHTARTNSRASPPATSWQSSGSRKSIDAFRIRIW